MGGTSADGGRWVLGCVRSRRDERAPAAMPGGARMRTTCWSVLLYCFSDGYPRAAADIQLLHHGWRQLKSFAFGWLNLRCAGPTNCVHRIQDIAKWYRPSNSKTSRPAMKHPNRAQPSIHAVHAMPCVCKKHPPNAIQIPHHRSHHTSPPITRPPHQPAPTVHPPSHSPPAAPQQAAATASNPPSPPHHHHSS